ncbi:MAG: dockerin type I repeat-containing protein [Planctomycetota bacterium]
MRAFLLVLALASFPQAACAQTIGPDVIVSLLPSIIKNGTLGGTSSYSMSTQSCNIGDTPAVWVPTTNQHPVIAQNFYRLENGRFEQIGMSWLKHGFCAANEPGCGTCQPTACETQGVMCADTYSVVANGTQTGMGPRSEVNAVTGTFVYPWGQAGVSGNVLYKRLQIQNADLDPAQHPTAKFYAEAHYVTPDEPSWGTQLNNASYREALVGALDNGGYLLSLTGPTMTQMSAIQAWASEDPSVHLEIAPVPGDGDFYLASKATDLGGNVWNYEYALLNYNSDRSAGSFELVLPAGSLVTNTGFHDPDYHSGEPYSATDWTSSTTATTLRWETETFATNADANAIRWGTLYNFRCDVDSPPALGSVTIGLFKPGVISDVTIPAMVPAACTTPPFVRGDVTADGSVNLTDAIGILAYLFNSAPAPTPLQRADSNGDGSYNLVDATYVLGYLFTLGPPPPFPFPTPDCI